MDTLRLYRHYIRVSLRSQMQYRASFLMLSAGQMFVCFTEFMGVVALFHRFGTLRGWRLAEIALLYGMVNVAFALAEAFGRGFDTFSALVKIGGFDRLLVRPRSTVLQVAGQELQIMRFGRLLQGTGVLLWATTTLNVVWTLPKLLLLLASILGGACVFFGLFVLQATLCFWTIESLEIMNTVTYGGTETGQYPLTVYRPAFRQFFTYIVPLACMNYIPASAILERGTELGVPPVLQWSAPLVGVLFLLISLRIWHFGVRRYTSTGS